MKTRIKICGITRIEQAKKIADLAVHALGFIFYPASKRFINIDQAKQIIDILPAWITTVGVFVNEDIEVVKDHVDRLWLDLVQLHGDESIDYCRRLTEMKIKWIKVIRVNESIDYSLIDQIPSNNIMFDTYKQTEYGGTGTNFDWNIINHAKLNKHIYLAGGINQNNIRHAIQSVRPHGIDISSAIEHAPGDKSLDKLMKILDVIK